MFLPEPPTRAVTIEEGIMTKDEHEAGQIFKFFFWAAVVIGGLSLLSGG